MPIKDLPSLGPIFGLTATQSEYALELVYHGVAGAWWCAEDPMKPLMKAMLEGPDSLSSAQKFAVLHTMLVKVATDWEAPILTGQPEAFAQAAFAALRFDAHTGPIIAIDHVQIAIPIGGERVAEPFYAGLLGLTQVAKPPAMAARGGAWYESGHVHVHLGVEADFRANDKAHVAFVVDDVAALAQKAADMGYQIKHDDALPGHKRAFIYDPFGNRIEILRKV